MTDRADLLAAILAHPDEDTPRLAYADWLQEHGDEARADFIRVQCERHRRAISPLPTDDPCTCTRTAEDFARYRAGTYCGACRRRNAPIEALERCERELLHDHEWDWLHAVCPELHRGSYDTETRTHHWLYPHSWARGFLDFVTCPAAAWLANEKSILAEHPIRTVRLTTWIPVDERFSPDGFAEWRITGRTYWVGVDELKAGDEVASHLLRKEWPKIRFELPSHVAV